MLSLKQVFAGCALIMALAVIGGRIRGYDPIRPELMEWPSSTNLAMQFVHTSIDAQMLIGPDQRYKGSLAAQQYWDFAFIAAYGALFTLVGMGMRKSQFELIRWAGWGVIGAASSAAVCDLAENATILATLRTPDYATWIRDFSMPKWIFVSLAISLASLLFMFWPRVPGWLRGCGIVTGAVFVAAGVYTLLAVADAALNLYGRIESDGAWVSTAMIAALIFWAAEMAHVCLRPRSATALPARAR